MISSHVIGLFFGVAGFVNNIIAGQYLTVKAKNLTLGIIGKQV